MKGSGAIKPARRYRRACNVSALAGVTAQRVVRGGGFNRELFVAFLRDRLAPRVRALRAAAAAWIGDRRFVLIMDNASIHKGELVRRVVEDELGMRLEYVAPYSPTFNPCENVFGKMKAVLRRRRHAAAVEEGGGGGGGDDGLMEMVGDALGEVHVEDVRGWCRLAGYVG